MCYRRDLGDNNSCIHWSQSQLVRSQNQIGLRNDHYQKHWAQSSNYQSPKHWVYNKYKCDWVNQCMSCSNIGQSQMWMFLMCHTLQQGWIHRNFAILEQSRLVKQTMYLLHMLLLLNSWNINQGFVDLCGMRKWGKNWVTALDWIKSCSKLKW